MTQEGFYFHDDSSEIAFVALYMPWLRTTIGGFVQMWNSHRIRKQPKRPNVKFGKPYMLYHYPDDDIINRGVSVDMASQEAVEAEVENYSKIPPSPYQPSN